MVRVTVFEAQQDFGQILERAAQAKEGTILARNGQDLAAVIPIEDLRLLERLIEEEEDRRDIAAADAALAEQGEDIPFEVIKEKYGL